ncbi:MAG: hypothetical protein ACN2B6_00135 [Rickettsiales bacterium]
MKWIPLSLLFSGCVFHQISGHNLATLVLLIIATVISVFYLVYFIFVNTLNESDAMTIPCLILYLVSSSYIGLAQDLEWVSAAFIIAGLSVMSIYKEGSKGQGA